MIPAAKAAGLCSAVDAFCETIAFDVPQTLRVLAAAQACGLGTKVHAEQLSRTGIAALAAEQGAWSVDHVEYLSEDDCRRLGQTSTVAVLLPGAFYYLRERQSPPVEALRRWKVPMAIATDANPGSSPIYSPLVVGNMAANLWGMSPREIFDGLTINAARAVNLHAELGSLEVGKWADLAVWDVDHPAELFYSLGLSPCRATYRAGQLLWSSLKDV
jgi:imidazolonepropionase